MMADKMKTARPASPPAPAQGDGATDGDDPSFGVALLAGLREAVSYQRGELPLRTRAWQRAGDTWALTADTVTVLATARTITFSPPPNYDSARIRAIRANLRLSQHLFAAALNVSQRTVQAWEQGGRRPDGPTLRLLEIAEERPETLLDKVAVRL